MKLHHIIDALRDSELVRRNVPGPGDYFRWWCRRVERTHKFDFGNMPVEQLYDCPRIERQAVAEGYFPLPFPECYFEHEITPWDQPVYTMGYYLLGESLPLAATPAVIAGTGSLPAECRLRCFPVRYQDEQADLFDTCFELLVPKGPDDTRIGGYGVVFETGVMDHAQRVETMGFVNAAVTVMLLLLAATTTSTTAVPAPARLNRQRLLKNRTPLFEHRLVSIVPHELRAEHARAVATSERASPRLHWRRAHRRDLGEGRITIVRRALIGVSSAGMVTKDYAVRRQQGDANGSAAHRPDQAAGRS